MSTKKKYFIGAAVLLAVFVAVICYASEIQVWFMSKITYLLILVIAFAVGWIIGRYGTRRLRSREQENIRNITAAQK